MADRDYRWRDERSYRRPVGERDFYRRDEMNEDDYGTGFGEEGMTNYRLREVRGNPRYWRLGEPGDPYARPPHSRHGYPRRDYARDFASDFSPDNEYGSRQFYGRGGERSRGRRWDDESDWRSGEQERGFWERAGDEVSSWFGDDDARHQGRGPKGYRRSDERIREDVSDKLTDDPFIDATDVEVAVSNGEVTLEGMVDSRMTRRRAEDLAERCSGVAHVQNNLRVTSASDTTREEREGGAVKRSSFLKS